MAASCSASRCTRVSTMSAPLPQPWRLLVAGIAWPPETFLRRLIDGLAASGVQVTVGSATRPQGAADPVRWLSMPPWECNRALRIARLARMATRAAMGGWPRVRALRRAVPTAGSLADGLRAWNQVLPFATGHWDVIYFPWNSAAVACLPVFDLRCPVVVSCRGSQVSVAPHNPARAELKQGLTATFQKAAAVHCVSRATLDDAVQLGLDPRKARVIHPAVDPAVFHPVNQRGSARGEFRVITVGSLNWRKAHEWALQAIRHVADAGVDVHFEIIGDGQDRQRVLYTIHDLGLQARVHWLGKRSPQEVLQRVQQADTFLLSSHSEGISNAVLEAMACGVPVVTTDCGGMREAVTDGVEGFVVPVRDSQAMATGLLQLAVSPELRERMGAAARTRVERDFNLKDQIRHWLDLYAAILSPQDVTAAGRASIPSPLPVARSLS